MSRVRLPRRSATNRKISFPVSAHECADSATIDAEPVRKAAIVFARATRRLALKATMTVSELSGLAGAAGSQTS
ncbi:hypothetical protein GCM10025867_22580 [Frondihabitans sucicola]|uniref:Uncharacterized protein n=1 Tax=Frondihabitans sucicola TaxID=1268041 RepID=A0ABM8GP59_9MICO|nr:hypothetical protein GCM10025867_22580 [Frondihabitans sucicola]